MLKSLHVHNFALLEDAEVEFSPGFNIFTGETGAGKSILIDAFGIVLGSRASTDYIRAGADAFWVQAVFDIAKQPEVQRLLKEQDIEMEDENLFLKRKLGRNGKGQCSLNGTYVPLGVMRSLSRLLVDIHGQHENQELARADAPCQLVDAAGGAKLQERLSSYREIYDAYRQGEKQLADLEKSVADRDILLDRLAWEIKEIADANLKKGEEAELQAENRRLQNQSRISEGVDEAHHALERESGALDQLAKAKEMLSDAQRYDESLTPLRDSLDSAWITADDVRQQLSEYMDNMADAREPQDQVQERLDLYYKLHKKYGPAWEDIQNYLAQAQQKYAVLKDLSGQIAAASARLQKLKSQLEQRGQALTDLRRQTAAKLSRALLVHLRDLAMPEGKFAIDFTAVEYGPDGGDHLVFMFSANKGEPLQPLMKIASGGELSRVALAVKTVLTHLSGVPTMVFDEIDTGVGGLTAQKMAEKMSLIADRSQVLCITHLPQMAVFADRQLYIYKDSAGERTVTKIKVLTGRERVEEIVRMTGGSGSSATAFHNAEELLAAAAAFKNNTARLRKGTL